MTLAGRSARLGRAIMNPIGAIRRLGLRGGINHIRRRALLLKRYPGGRSTVAAGWVMRGSTGVALAGARHYGRLRYGWDRHK